MPPRALSSFLPRTVTNSYDSIYRLTKEISVAGSTTTTTSYNYDSDNNRLSKAVQVGTTTTTTNYVYNTLNQLTSTSNALVSSFSYDADGNRVKTTEGSMVDTYTYDLKIDWSNYLSKRVPQQERERIIIYMIIVPDAF